MVPGASSPARAMASPRATTSWIPCSKPRAPLATSAVYSPRLCPAQAAGVRPMRSTASSTTRLSTVVASCAFSVWVSSSIGACEQQVGQVAVGGGGRLFDDFPRGVVDPRFTHAGAL